jgi:hypothetical protein
LVGHADRDREPQLLAHAAPDRLGDFGRRPEQMFGTLNVGEGLIDGDPLDRRREVAHDLYGRIAQPRIVLEMAADKDELGAELARPAPRHSAADPERLGFVGRRQHHPAADRDGFAAQRRIQELLDRGIEGVQVRMEDGGHRVHPGAAPRRRGPRVRLE